MKTKILALAMTLAMVFSFGNTFAKNEKKKVVFNAELHCKSCKAKIEKNLPFEKGVKDLKVDMKAKTIAIVYRTDKTTEAKLIKAIEKCGVKVFGKACCGDHKGKCKEDHKHKEECTGHCGSCKSKACEKEQEEEHTGCKAGHCH